MANALQKFFVVAFLWLNLEFRKTNRGTSPFITIRLHGYFPLVISLVVAQAPGADNVGNGVGKQFITGQCTSDADCAGPDIAQEVDGGCGFVDAQPNNNAAPSSSVQASAPTTSATIARAREASPTNSAATDEQAPGAAKVGNVAGNQFITGQCTSDADCESGCCGFNSGKCAGPIIAQTRDGGCGFVDAQPGGSAARKLQNQD